MLKSKLLIMTAVLGVMIALTGCSNSESESTESAKQSDKYEITLKDECDLAFQKYSINVPDSDNISRVAEVSYFDVDVKTQDGSESVTVFVPVFSGSYTLEHNETPIGTSLEMAGNIAYDSRLDLTQINGTKSKEKKTADLETLVYTGSISDTEDQEYCFTLYEAVLDKEYKCQVLAVAKSNDTEMLASVCEQVIESLKDTAE